MPPVVAALADRLFRPSRVGRLTLPGPGLIVLATIGALLLFTVASLRWLGLQDEHAYWVAAQRLIAGQALYDPSAVPGTPYAYWYPPPLAQVLAPLTLVLPDLAFSLGWTVLLAGCLLWLADRRILVALAMIAFLPVAVELWYRNVHLLLAALVVVALRRTPYAWIPAAAIKVTPALGVLYLVASRRYRDALLVSIAGAAVLAISVALSPGAWSQFFTDVISMGSSSGASILPIPFSIRFASAVVLALVGGRAGGRRGESILVVALVLGNPTLWATAFSLLVALVPIWSRPRPMDPGRPAAGPRDRVAR
jgi:hypothetical protein